MQFRHLSNAIRRSAEQIELRDDIIDALFDKVKDEVVEALKSDSSQSDMAVDLLMLAKYLERIGDHAVNVLRSGPNFQIRGR